MKKAIVIALVISICVSILAGCGGLTESVKNPVNTVNTATSVTNGSDISTVESVITTTRVSITTEKEKTAAAAQTTLTETAKTIVQIKTKSKTESMSSSKAARKQTQSVKTTAKPNTETSTKNKIIPTTVEKKEVIDIAYYENYAKSYAKQIGLTYDSSATDCWDNPIIVSATNDSYVKRDIKGYLNSYKNVEGFESICVWSKKRTDGKYDLYIGYS